MGSGGPPEDGEAFPWSLGVYDAHCHPTDTMASIDSVPSMHAKALTVMATRAQDQALVEKVADEQRCSLLNNTNEDDGGQHRRQIVPAFGWHPWFSHQLYDDTQSLPLQHTQVITERQKRSHYDEVLKPSPVDDEYLDQLPEPRRLSQYLAETKDRLERHPEALVGEVGLDKSFRLPNPWLPNQTEERDKNLTAGGREGRDLSPYRVQMNHQTAVLLAQLKLAGELQRPVSLHGVRCTGVLFETLQQTWKGHEREVLSKAEQRRRQVVLHTLPRDAEGLSSSSDTSVAAAYPPRVCLHSYSGDPGFLKQYFHGAVPIDFYVSFSTVINFGPQSAAWSTEAIKVVPDDRLLIESDLHTVGVAMDDNLESIARKICLLKDWSLQQGVQQLSQNWKAFVYGS